MACFWFSQEENYPTQIYVWTDLFLIWTRAKWSELRLCLNRIVSDSAKRKIICVVEFNCLWLYQEKNYLTWICGWINLCMIRPRGELSDSYVWLNRLVFYSTNREIIRLYGIDLWIVCRSRQWRVNWSIPCSFDINRGSSLVVTHRKVGVLVTLDRPGTP